MIHHWIKFNSTASVVQDELVLHAKVNFSALCHTVHIQIYGLKLKSELLDDDNSTKNAIAQKLRIIVDMTKDIIIFLA